VCSSDLLRALYALLARALAPYPRARAFVEAVAAMAPDLLRFVAQVYALLTGRPLPSPESPPVVLPSPVAPPPRPASPMRAVTVSSRPSPPSADPLLDAARASVRAELGELIPSTPPPSVGPLAPPPESP
jgi:hypothetical protein